MGRQAVIVLYVLAMAGIVVGVDVLFLRLQSWHEAVVNVAIVLVFGAVCWRILRRSCAHSGS